MRLSAVLICPGQPSSSLPFYGSLPPLLLCLFASFPFAPLPVFRRSILIRIHVYACCPGQTIFACCLHACACSRVCPFAGRPEFFLTFLARTCSSSSNRHFCRHPGIQNLKHSRCGLRFSTSNRAKRSRLRKAGLRTSIFRAFVMQAGVEIKQEVSARDGKIKKIVTRSNCGDA